MEVEFEITKRNYKRASMDKMLNLLKGSTERYYVRYGSECSELIFDGLHNVYAAKKKNFPNNKICLFNMVKRNCEKFLVDNPFIVLPEQKPVSAYNFDYDHTKGVITGTDLDHAYWRIAFIKGYISEKTYLFGLDEKCKALRLATISTLGREKKYELYQGSELIESVVLVKKDEQLRRIYKDVRLSCFFMLSQLAEVLGDEFDCYKTDCIYYRDTPENRKIVHDFFIERNMPFKQLIYDKSIDAEEVEY